MKTIKIRTVLKRLLKERGMTAIEVSRASGVANSTVATWISGSIPKDPAQTAAVATVLGISLHQLLFDEPDAEGSSFSGVQTEVVLDGFYRLKLERVITKK